MTLNDINDVQNAARATTLLPRSPDDNALFRRGIQLLAEIDDRGGAEIGFATSEDSEPSSDPISPESVQGRDVLDAAKDGYVFRASGNGKLKLAKRERDLTLKIRSRFTHSPEMEEFAQIFNLTPGLSRSRIKSELQPNAESSPAIGLPRGDTIYLNLRSILQIMTFLSKGVCVPEEHVCSGLAPNTPGPNGRPFDWTRVTADSFFVRSQKHKPRDAEVSVFYRGYWFYIPKSDVDSRSVLAVLEILFGAPGFRREDRGTGPHASRRRLKDSRRLLTRPA